MKIKNLSVYPVLVFSSRFLTAQRPLPKSSSGDAGKGPSRVGMTDSGHNAHDALAAVQVHGGARAPPAGLIFQCGNTGHDPKAPLKYHKPLWKFSERMIASFRRRSST